MRPSAKGTLPGESSDGTLPSRRHRDGAAGTGMDEWTIDSALRRVFHQWFRHNPCLLGDLLPGGPQSDLLVGIRSSPHSCMVPVAVLLCFDCTGGKGETVLHVQDFSDAHRRGLQVGFAKVKREYTRISWADATEDELVREGEGILGHVKGCVFHYKQSVLRLSKKRMMIPHAQAERFKELAHRLLTRSASKFERTTRELRREFPLVTTAGRRKRGWTGPGWLEW